MKILPITYILPEEKELFGEEAIALSVLTRAGIPVKPAYVIIPEDYFVPLFLKHLPSLEKDQIENKLAYLEKIFTKCSYPVEVFAELNKIFPCKLAEYIGINTLDQLNAALNKVWWEEIINHHHSNRLSWQNLHRLKPGIIVQDDNKGKLVQAHFDPMLKKVVIEEDINLSVEDTEKIEKLVLSAHKLLTFPFHYQIIISPEGPFIAGVKPWIHSEYKINSMTKQTEVKTVPAEKKRILKIVQKISEGL